MKLIMQPNATVRGVVRGWPHPGRPGWPHHYDRAGYFCVEDLATQKRYSFLWDPVTEEWDTGVGGASPSVVGRFRYLGPCTIVYRTNYDPMEWSRFKRPGGYR